jgi:hypothetical protein
MRRDLWMRVMLAGLAWSALLVGAWATFAPRSFYDSFPGGGETWVAVDGPYNQHLVGDVGALNLALVVVTVWALVTLDRRLVQVASVAWLVYSVPHLYYHSTHRDPFETGSLVAALTSLALGVVVPVVLLVMTRRPESAPVDQAAPAPA